MNNPEHDIEGPEPEKCETCEGTGEIKFSDCCGAQVINQIDGITLRIPICHDCGNQCNVEKDKCETCKGAGSIPFDEESARDDHYERKMESLRGND